MRTYLCKVTSAVTLAVGLSLAGVCDGQEKKADTASPSSRTPVTELLHLLDRSYPTKQHSNPTTLRDALRHVQEWFEAQGRSIPITIDVNAFKEENAESADPYDAQVHLPGVPRDLPVGRALWLLFSQIPTNNAAYVLRNGGIEITTRERARPAYLLRERVTVTYKERPLDEALADLAERSGVTILVDPRAGDKAKAPVSAVFRASVTVENAVRLLAEMAELQVMNEDDVLFVTARKAAPAAGARLEFRNRRLDDALREVSETTKATIVLDPAIREAIQGLNEPNDPGGKARRPDMAVALGGESERPPTYRVTATFQPGVKAETATRVLAAMTGLSVVKMGEALFVTTYDTAAQLQNSLPATP